jgi:hypothetical protein
MARPEVRRFKFLEVLTDGTRLVGQKEARMAL